MIPVNGEERGNRFVGNMTKGQIVDDLRQAILEERFEQGQSLVERELCEKYHVSRTPIREVLWRLVLDGVVEQRPSRGFFVRKLDWEQIFELYQTREAVEGMAVRLCAQRGEPEVLQRFEDMIRTLEELDVMANPRDGMQIGRAMHRLIMESSHNRFLHEYHEKIGYLARLISNITIKAPTIEETSKQYHLTIMRAITRGDAERSETLMREHLRITCRNVIKTFYPEVFGPGVFEGDSLADANLLGSA